MIQSMTASGFVFVKREDIGVTRISQYFINKNRSFDRLQWSHNNIAGNEASQQGIIVCTVDKKRNLPKENIALPRSIFHKWLKEIIN